MTNPISAVPPEITPSFTDAGIQIAINNAADNIFDSDFLKSVFNTQNRDSIVDSEESVISFTELLSTSLTQSIDSSTLDADKKKEAENTENTLLSLISSYSFINLEFVELSNNQAILKGVMRIHYCGKIKTELLSFQNKIISEAEGVSILNVPKEMSKHKHLYWDMLTPVIDNWGMKFLKETKFLNEIEIILAN